jgi:hypothetical protein
VPLPELRKLCVAGKMQFSFFGSKEASSRCVFFLPRILERKDDEPVRVHLEHIWPLGANDLVVQERFLMMMMIWERHLLIQ